METARAGRLLQSSSHCAPFAEKGPAKLKTLELAGWLCAPHLRHSLCVGATLGGRLGSSLSKGRAAWGMRTGWQLVRWTPVLDCCQLLMSSLNSDGGKGAGNRPCCCLCSGAELATCTYQVSMVASSTIKTGSVGG